MENRRFKPKVDKLFFIILIPTVLLLLGATALAAFEPRALIFIVIPVDIITFYFIISPLFGYVELRDSSLYIKYGFIMKREIPYTKIRGTVLERRFYSESMMSLKNALIHVNIKYNLYDVTTVSVVENDLFVEALTEKIEAMRS